MQPRFLAKHLSLPASPNHPKRVFLVPHNYVLQIISEVHNMEHFRTLTEKHGQVSEKVVICFQCTLHHRPFQDANNKLSHARTFVPQLHQECWQAMEPSVSYSLHLYMSIAQEP